MSSNNSITAPYLLTSRNFPNDIDKLSDQLGKAYIDTANAVNARTIGIFPTRKPIVTGESWFIDNNNRQQTLRQVYSFGAIAAGASISIPTGITNITSINIPTRLYGMVLTDFPDYRPIPFVAVNLVTSQIAIRLNINTNSIVIAVGATSANVVRGFVVLEWLSEK